MKIPIIHQLFGRNNVGSTIAEPSVEVSPLATYKKSRGIPQTGPACLAPWTSISFGIDGFATVCCQNRKTTVSISGKTISEVWNSDEFKKLRERVGQDDLTYDCSICLNQINGGNKDGVKAGMYDQYPPADPQKPALMEFCLENTCNLECVMCNTLLSSSIRIREKLPPIPKHYTEAFADDLEQYIPYLKEAIFSGGEPFLIPLYHKIWEKMLRINPDIVISVITNGSTLNSRIKDLLERGKFRINMSIDAVHKETYEAIRRNADFDVLMHNFEWFKNYSKRRGMPLNVPACPMTNNWQGIPDIVRFGNQHEVSVNFVYVDRPMTLSLYFATPQLLGQIIERYESEEFEEDSEQARTNVRRFRGLIKDIAEWKALNEKQAPVTDDLREQLVQRINDANDMQTGDVPTDVAKQELRSIINSALNQLNADQQERLLKALSTYSIDRLYQFMKGKTFQEVVTFVNEYVGK